MSIVPDEGNPQDVGGNGSASQQPSQPTDQPLGDVTAMQKRIDELEKLYKGIQKGNDKVNARVEQKIDNLSRILDLAKEGKSKDEIEERLILDEILRERKSSTPAVASGEPRQSGVDILDVAKQLNLDMNDKDIAAAVASGNVVNVMKVAMSKVSTPSPSPADAPPLLGGAAQPRMKEEEANQKLLQLDALSREPTKNAAQLRALQKELKEAGVL